MKLRIEGRNTAISVLIGMLACSALAVSATAQSPIDGAGASTPQQGPMDEKAFRTRADALLAQMTLEEKAGQLTQYAYFSLLPAPMRTSVEVTIANPGVGSLFGVADPAEINRLQKIALEKTRLKIPVMFSNDIIHGMRTTFPIPLGMAASWDPQLYEQAQGVAAAEARAVGIVNTFAPMVDIARDPRWGRIVEGAGEDPYLGAAMAAAQVHGFQGAYLGAPGHVMTGTKHFAGYGAALGGRDYDEANIADALLWNVYLKPFEAAVKAGTGSLMSAYMPLNGVPASANRWLLTDVLRDTWGFKGIVDSDDSAVNSLVTQGFAADKQDAAIRALHAGLDLEMVGPSQTAAFMTLPEAIKDGKVSETEVDNAVRGVLETKIRLGLFEHPYVDAASGDAVLHDPAHLELARVAAERSAVLLKNDGALLPLDRKTVKSLAVIGPLANSATDALGPWAVSTTGAPTQSIFAGLKARLGSAIQVSYAEGVSMPERVLPTLGEELGIIKRPPPKSAGSEAADIRTAVALAKKSDISIVVVGETAAMEGENASSSSLDLPGAQQQLLDAVVATGKPVVVLIMSGRPLNLMDTKARAILDIWYPGSAGGDAVAALLFGDVNPGGKLPITWIRSASQAPNPYGHLLSFDADHADKRYWNGSSQPTYPFGYGLSYTTFQYTDLRVDTTTHHRGEPMKVSVDLTNAGRRAGDEVAQLYIHQHYGTSAKPVRELKGFQRVSLQPGETRTLTFTLQPDDLRYWSAATHGWVQDEAPFDIWVGGDSQATLAGHFEIKD